MNHGKHGKNVRRRPHTSHHSHHSRSSSWQPPVLPQPLADQSRQVLDRLSGRGRSQRTPETRTTYGLAALDHSHPGAKLVNRKRHRERLIWANNAGCVATPPSSKCESAGPRNPFQSTNSVSEPQSTRIVGWFSGKTSMAWTIAKSVCCSGSQPPVNRRARSRIIHVRSRNRIASEGWRSVIATALAAAGPIPFASRVGRSTVGGLAEAHV